MLFVLCTFGSSKGEICGGGWFYLEWYFRLRDDRRRK